MLKGRIVSSVIEADMAWDSLARPDVISFKYIPPADIARAICDTISEVFAESCIGMETMRSLKPVTDPAGHYSIKIGSKRLFLRVSRRKRKDINIEDMAAFYLSNSGEKVSLPIISGLKVIWRGNSYLLYVFQMLEGRHFNGSDADIVALAFAVKRMHESLKLFKFSETVRSHAFKSAARLTEVKKLLKRSLKRSDFSVFCEREAWARKNREWLETMAGNFEPYLCKLPEAQCVHGELHLGNVIFSAKDRMVIFTDLEEVPDSFFPVSFDLAYIAQRFCMDGIVSRQPFRKRLDIFCNHYGSMPLRMSGIMRQICWRNIAILIDKSVKRESVSPEAEYDKFVNLDHMTVKLMR